MWSITRSILQWAAYACNELLPGNETDCGTFSGAGLVDIDVSVTPKKENRGDGYVDHPYSLKLLQKLQRGGVSRSAILSWLLNLETRARRVKVTNITLDQHGNVPSDSWDFDGEVVHREPASGSG